MEVHSDGGLTLSQSTLHIHEPKNSLYPDVFVGKLRDEDRQSLAQGKPVKGVLLGADEQSEFQLQLTQAIVQDLHGELMKQANDAFILMWEGNKIPRGAVVNGYAIGWTQNGQVLSVDGEMIGVYDRILEYGGESEKEQQMLVFLTVEPKGE